MLPSSYEAFSLASLEAAACGLPVVVSGVSGSADLVGDVEAGILVERRADAVADAVVRLADPAFRVRCGTTARRRAEDHSWERVAADTVALYRQLLGEAGLRRAPLN